MRANTIAIYFSDPEPMGYPFNFRRYFEVYQWIINDLARNGIASYIVRGDSYLGEGFWGCGWLLRNYELKKSAGRIRCDLIFNRDDKNTMPIIRDCRVVNNYELDEICLNKLKTAKMFPRVSPKTDEVHSFGGFVRLLSKRRYGRKRLIVVKKNFSTNCRGAYILPVAGVHKDLYDDWRHILVQEFLDSSRGIDGVVKGIHDLRLNIVNNRVVNAFLRQPPAGGYIANVFDGGTARAVSLDKLPKGAYDLAAKVMLKFNKYKPAVYAVDMFNTSKGYRLIELNSRPGVQHKSTISTYKDFNDAVVRMLVEVVNGLK